MEKMWICGVEFGKVEGWEDSEKLWGNVYNCANSRKTNTKGMGKKHEDAVKAWEYIREIGVKNGWIKGEGKVKYPHGMCVEDLEDYHFDSKRKDNVYNAWSSMKSRCKRRGDMEGMRMWDEDLMRLKVEKKRRELERMMKK